MILRGLDGDGLADAVCRALLDDIADHVRHLAGDVERPPVLWHPVHRVQPPSAYAAWALADAERRLRRPNGDDIPIHERLVWASLHAVRAHEAAEPGAGVRERARQTAVLAGLLGIEEA